jgi:hypothetical protein
MTNRYETYVGENGFIYTQVINEYGYPATWDLHPLMGRYVSVFYAPISNVTRSKNLSLFHIYELIRNSSILQQHTAELRALNSKEEQDEYKRKYLPSACFAGTFSRCANKAIVTYSGLQCLDLDNLGEELLAIKNKICALPQTIICFVSPRGNGLKVVYPVDLTLKLSYAEQYRKIAGKLCDLCHIPAKDVDKKSSNVSRRCFLPFDADCFLNPLLR